MKKILTISLMILLVTTAIFAVDFDLILGVNGQYNGNVKSIFNTNSKKIMDQMQFGPEARMKLGLFEFDVKANVSKNIDSAKTDKFFSRLIYGGTCTAGVSFDVKDLVRLGFGVGTTVNYNPKSSTLLIGNKQATSKNFKAVVKDAPIIARATADVMLGNVIAGINCDLNTQVSINTLKSKNFGKMVPTVGAFCGIKLF